MSNSPTFSGILIGVVCMALIVSGFIIFLADGATQYGRTDADMTGLNTLKDQFNDVNKTAYDVKDKIERVTQSDASVFDKIGYFFQSGYDALKLLFKSFTTSFKIVDVSISESSSLLGSYAGILKVMIGALLIVVIFIMIVLRILIKSEQV